MPASSQYPEPKLIGEIGCNHKGEMEIAREMISTAAIFCKTGILKFQKRNPRELLSEEQYNQPHPNPMHAYGETYGEHREFLEFTVDQHRQLKNWCEEFKMTYACSVWDMTSAREIASLEPAFIKIPSASNLHREMLTWLCDNYGGEIHVSLGMTTRSEEEELVEFFLQKGRAGDVVLYSCTSGYPVPFEDICLMEIPRLRLSYGGHVKSIGFSGHHLGIAVDIAAYTLGAEWIERHYTLDRTWKGTDHSASLEPDGLRRLGRNLSAVQQAMTGKQSDLLDIEIPQREKLKYRADVSAH